MVLLPLVPSAHPSARLAEAAGAERQDYCRHALERAHHTCQFCGLPAGGWQDREERKQAGEETRKLTAGAPAIGDAMSPFKENEILSARHHAYVQRVMTAFKNHGITVTQLEPAEALVAVREAVYPEPRTATGRR